MTTNLLETLSREFSGEVVNRIANVLGEESNKTKVAIEGALPSLVGGLINRASTSGGARELLDFLKRNHFDGSELTFMASTVSRREGISHLIEAGCPLISDTLGSRAKPVIDRLSSLSGVSKTSATSVLGLALPVVLGQVGRLVSNSGWSVSNLMNLLAGQKNYIRNSALEFAGIPGFSFSDHIPEAHSAAVSPSSTEPVRHGFPWWKWLPLLLGALLLGYFLFRREASKVNVDVQPTATMPTVALPPVKVDLGAFIGRKLPNGVTIKIQSNGVESRLIAFIEDPDMRVDKETWFSFDRLEFETDSATLMPESGEQLRNISEILKAYPNVNVKIGGYTDNVGNEAYNLKLSGERATNTMREIEKLGISGSRLAAEGYGQQYPVADNSTEEGRQQNRRVDIRVTKK
jgi:OmpA-OmpF porin, OOP family